MMKFLIGCFLSLFALQVSAQNLVDQKAPEIEVDQWLNPEDKTPETDGQWVVLDFWFTTCAPCVFTLPHLNDLADAFKRENITFLAVTFEEAQQVNKFLKDRQLKAQIGLDTTYQTIKAFQVKGYPETFVIDPQGIVRWQGYPLNLSTDLLVDLIGGTLLPQGIQASQSLGKLKKEVTEDEFYPIDVDENNYMGPVAKGFQRTLKEITITNYTLKGTLAYLMNRGESRILSEDTTRYDIRFTIPRKLNQRQVSAEMAKSLLKKVGYSATIEFESVDGYALNILNDSLLNANAVQSRKMSMSKGQTFRYGNWEGEGVEMEDLIKVLENKFDVVIRNATEYNPVMDLTFTLSDFDKAQEELKEKYGLILVPKRFEVELMKILPGDH